jgi:uncharacterized SAM-binding protein YcdF (DUF218 family)
MRTSIKLSLGAAGTLAGWMSLATLVGHFLVVERPLERADAIVVLSGSAEYPSRTRTAAELWRTQVAPTIFITDDGQLAGWDSGLQRNPAFFELMRRSLEAEGVPPDRIIVIPGHSDGTYEEAILVSKFIRERGLRSIMLVTSGFHTRRTLWVFVSNNSGRSSDVMYGISCADSDKQFPAKAFWWLTVSGWRDTPPELLKLAYYWWAY